MDPSANPYLSIAAMLTAGLDGIEEKLQPEEAVDRNIYRMAQSERLANHIQDLPSTLHNALKYLETDEVVQSALGDHLYHSFLDSKNVEWAAYRQQVSEWEREQYLELY